MHQSKALTVFVLLAAAAFCASAAFAAEANGPCATSPGARQLDYWLGDWTVSSPGMAGKGHSTVHLELDRCVVVESWASDTSDHHGENTLAYSAEQKTWYGLFADNHGRAHMFSGTATGAAAELAGPGLDENGNPLLKRVRVVRVDAAKVEQIWEHSTDHGATWVTEFKMEYVRKQP
jgi:hypothetical protein